METPANPPPEPTEPADPLALGQAAALQLGGEWQLDTISEEPLPAESEESGVRSEEKTDEQSDVQQPSLLTPHS